MFKRLKKIFEELFYLMPLDKPIPDSVINYWKKTFNDYLSKFREPKKAN